MQLVDIAVVSTSDRSSAVRVLKPMLADGSPVIACPLSFQTFSKKAITPQDWCKVKFDPAGYCCSCSRAMKDHIDSK